MIDDPRSPRDQAPAPDGALEPGAGTVAVRAGPLQRLLSLDEALLVEAQRLRHPAGTAVARALTRLGDGTSWTAVSLACLATRTARGAHLGLRIGAAAAVAALLAQVLKRALARARPDSAIAGFEALAENPDRFSFPSGHTAAAVAVAVALAGEPLRLGAPSLVLAAGIGLSRVYLGAHYPLDVAAGAALGVLGGLAARLVAA